MVDSSAADVAGLSDKMDAKLTLQHHSSPRVARYVRRCVVFWGVVGSECCLDDRARYKVTMDSNPDSGASPTTPRQKLPESEVEMLHSKRADTPTLPSPRHYMFPKGHAEKVRPTARSYSLDADDNPAAFTLRA
jgi:hypothetical protein